MGDLCASCGSPLTATAKFCSECGRPRARSTQPAEYKQVTVLFADVVGSMKLAALLGPERLREVMTQVFELSARAVQRYGGTVDKFTGDGIMAVFGAPAALEDHAMRACLAALQIQAEMHGLARSFEGELGISLLLRVGLNSGQVIAGEIGSGSAGYTAIGEQVGMAQRMESVAAPGGVMVSESTAVLVEHAAVLGESELVKVKGADVPIPARRLLAVNDERARRARREPTLVGRVWELNTLSGILDQSMGGDGCVVALVGPPGIGKSRTVSEATRLAAERCVEVFGTYCESHTSDVPFHVVTRLLRAVFGIGGVGADVARTIVRARIPGANADDLLLLDDLLGIGDPAVALPAITPDARGRRLTALLNAAALARSSPAVYVIEDVHWIDEASEAMFAEFVTVVPQTSALVLLTYRPEYDGPLSRPSGGQTISLSPLNTAQTRALVRELLGDDPSVDGVAEQVAEQALGNPFFAEEIIRDLDGRGVLAGHRGQYVCREKAATITLPSTLQATIAARIDRLPVPAKQVLHAAAIIGARFAPDMLNTVIGGGVDVAVALADLLQVELIDQVQFTPHAEYAFRHPLVRTVAYESQLKAERAERHRRVAAVIQERDPDSIEQNAALIAEHLEAAGDLRAAFDWHMRAGAWSNHRDLGSARTSWQRASQVADRLPVDEPDRVRMQIEPRTLLCATAFMVGGAGDIGFDELRELCAAANDDVSLAMGIAGVLMAVAANGRPRYAAELSDEFAALLEAIGDPTLTVGLLYAGVYAKSEAGEARKALQWADYAVELADGDATRGAFVLASPLAVTLSLRGFIKMRLGIPGWQADSDAAVAMAAPIDATVHLMTLLFKYVLAIPFGACPADASALESTAEALRLADERGDETILNLARLTHGMTQIHHGGSQVQLGVSALAKVRDSARRGRFVGLAGTIVDHEMARQLARQGDWERAIELARKAVDDDYASGDLVWLWLAVTALVEALIGRGTEEDLHEARSVIDRFAAVPTDPGYVLHELTVLRLRGLLAEARGDKASHDDWMAQLHARATELGFEPIAASAKLSR